MVFECLVSVCGFVDRSGVLPNREFAHRKSLGTCDALLCLSYTLKSVLESGQEGSIVLIDSIEAFDRVNRQGILYMLCLVGTGMGRFYKIDHSSLWPSVVELNTAAGQCFVPVIVSPVLLGALSHTEE